MLTPSTTTLDSLGMVDVTFPFLPFPRVRDFHGINPNSFDGRGNYAMGIKEQLIFPEIEYDKVRHGLLGDGDDGLLAGDGGQIPHHGV